MFPEPSTLLVLLRCLERYIVPDRPVLVKFTDIAG